MAENSLPKSLLELRQSLIAKGVPSRDVPIEGIGLDLADERTLLSAAHFKRPPQAGEQMALL